MKFAFFDAKEYDIPYFEKYGKTNGIDFTFFDTRLTEDTAMLTKGYDGVCVFVNDSVNSKVIDLLYSYGINLIALRCAGFNNVDVEYAFGKVHVVRVPAYSPYAVAEHAMALILTSIRRIHKAYIRTKDHNFSLSGLKGYDLHGKTVGIIGTGKIGLIFADICKGFGMTVLGYDKFPRDNTDIEYKPLDDIFRMSDIISLHCPLSDESYHMISAENISKMKKGVVIVNTSRGALIDTDALLDGIKSRKIGAACLDVYEEESDLFFSDRSGHILDDDTLARLITMPNVIVTSHQAFLTEEALDNIAETTVKNITEFFNNGCSENEVCYHCGKIEDCKNHRIKKCF